MLQDGPACQQQIVSYLPICTWIGLSFIRSGQYERAMDSMEVSFDVLKVSRAFLLGLVLVADLSLQLCDAGCVRPCLEAGIRCHKAFCHLQ